MQTPQEEAVPFKTFAFQIVDKTGKNVLFQEAESKRNTDFLAPDALVYDSILNAPQVLIPKKSSKSYPYLFLGLRQMGSFGIPNLGTLASSLF